ncbi:MAG: shikimate kinase [Clostridium sp.]|jgi:shikimate dehydrogenase|nr:shikimate kinase [Clostridium sp.]
MPGLEYGLIGRSLKHSCSPELHAGLGDYGYSLVELEPERLGSFLLAGDFKGLNVTIPYKQAVIPFCGEISERARVIGAVNTLVRRGDGSLFGDNTDCAGFIYACRLSGIGFAGERVLVLGDGGASKAVCRAVWEMGAEKTTVISRKGENRYDMLPRFADYTRIINTTPVGMFPHCGDEPLIDLRAFPHCGGVADVIYNPLRTRLLQQAQLLGIPAAGGLPMLAAQAEYSRRIWFGQGEDGAEKNIARALAELTKKRRGIALIGMPGCGKSTVGRLLAAKAGLDFADADEELERRAGMDIPRIFAEHGEAYFRGLESEVLAELCASGGRVIAAGGGAILREKNRTALRFNSRVVWLRRPLEELATDGRPLSQGGAARRLWEERKALYAQTADLEVDNRGTAEDCAEKILSLLA